jgi:hypothetical protein
MIPLTDARSDTEEIGAALLHAGWPDPGNLELEMNGRRSECTQEIVDGATGLDPNDEVMEHICNENNLVLRRDEAHALRPGGAAERVLQRQSAYLLGLSALTVLALIGSSRESSV